MILRPDTGKGERHTLHNVLKTECWTLNGFRLDSAAQAHQTSAPYAKNVSEFSACGFDAEWRMGTDAPYVKSSPLQVGCRLREHQALNINGTHLLIGEVTALYCAADAQRDDGSLDLAKLDLATVSGLDTYSEPGKSRRFDLARVDTPLREQ
jgi:flavin reductase (DIM6/NTAB) family NADH-FMN oxidoreductase RutF